MVADGVNLARVLGRLEAAALSPSAGRPSAPLTSLLAQPFDRFEPPTVDQVLGAVLASAESPATTSPVPTPGRTANPMAVAPSTIPAPRSDPGAIDSGRWLAPRRWSAAAPSTGSSQAERPPLPGDAADDAVNGIGRPTPSRGPHPQPTWRSVMPVRVGERRGGREPAGQYRGWIDGADADGRPSTAQLRRWADTTNPTPTPEATPTHHRVRSIEPSAGGPVTPSARTTAMTAPGHPVGAVPGPHPAPATAPTPRPPARSSGPIPSPGRTQAEVSPGAGPTSSPRQPLSLRTLGAAWQEQASPAAAASQPAPSIAPAPAPASAPPAPAGPGPATSTPPRSLDQVAELAGADVDLESTLMTMLERGLRAEARRYGVDLEGWEIQ